MLRAAHPEMPRGKLNAQIRPEAVRIMQLCKIALIEKRRAFLQRIDVLFPHRHGIVLRRNAHRL